LCNPASIDDERRCGRESCVVGTEVKNRSSDFLADASPPDRNHRSNLIARKTFEHLGCDHTGSDRIDANVLSSEFERDRFIPELSPRPTEGVFDKLTMSAFEGTWLDFALRDCGINAFVIVGVATEIGIEPTARQAANLGYIPVLVADACGAGNKDAAKRSIESLKFAGDAMLTDTETICTVFRQRSGVRR
jgi:nicotinamidase-related amidase